MTSPVSLSMTGDQHDRLRQFLFPADGKEAVAIVLCGHCDGDSGHRLVGRAIEEIPYSACKRPAMQITWPPDLIAPLLDRALDERLSVVKVHSHPGGYAAFSGTDDEGDSKLLPMIRGWIEADIPHGSVVMLPSGEMFGRLLRSNGTLEPMAMINVVGDDFHFWYPDAGSVELPSFVASHAQAFDEGTIRQMGRLSFAVYGASRLGRP